MQYSQQVIEHELNINESMPDDQLDDDQPTNNNFIANVTTGGV